MINIQELLAASKAKENNQLVKGFGSLFNSHPDDYSQERFNIGVAFSSEERRNKLSSPNPSRNYLIGMVVTQQSKVIWL